MVCFSLQLFHLIVAVSLESQQAFQYSCLNKCTDIQTKTNLFSIHFEKQKLKKYLQFRDLHHGKQQGIKNMPQQYFQKSAPCAVDQPGRVFSFLGLFDAKKVCFLIFE